MQQCFHSLSLNCREEEKMQNCQDDWNKLLLFFVVKFPVEYIPSNGSSHSDPFAWAIIRVIRHSLKSYPISPIRHHARFN